MSSVCMVEQQEGVLRGNYPSEKSPSQGQPLTHRRIKKVLIPYIRPDQELKYDFLWTIFAVLKRFYVKQLY